MSIRLTSIAAYRDLKESGKLDEQKCRIIKIVAKRANSSLQEIMKEYRKFFGNIELSSVSGRVNELKYDETLVCEVAPRKCTITGITVNPVRINEAI